MCIHGHVLGAMSRVPSEDYSLADRNRDPDPLSQPPPISVVIKKPFGPRDKTANSDNCGHMYILRDILVCNAVYKVCLRPKFWHISAT